MFFHDKGLQYRAEPAASDPTYAKQLQEVLVSGLGAQFKDANGVPWNTSYIIASGNLLADFRANVNAESQGRLQVARLYGMTDDPGVRDMLSFMLARDTMHQNMWLAAIEQLKEDGLEDDPVPSDFPLAAEQRDAAYQMLNLSQGEESREGRWASGPTSDGKGEVTYVADPQGTGEPTPPKHLYVTGNPRGMASGLVDKVKAKL